MSASLVITQNPGGGALVTYGTTPDYTVGAGVTWVRGFAAGALEYEKAFPDSPGTDGTGRKRFGFRQRKISVTVTYVNTTYNQVFADVMTDLATYANQSMNVALAGYTFYACELDSATTVAQPQPTGLPSGNFYCLCTLVFIQKGLS